jgi:hypothetical protein
MRSTAMLLAGLAALLAVRDVARADGPAPAVPPTGPAEGIAWTKTVDEAFDAGKKDGKPVFIAVSSERVDGGKLEPAGQMLRDQVYVDPAVVAKSRSFACAMLRGDGTSADYAAVRQHFGIDGLIVSPQHLFAFPDGTLIKREEYWPTRGVPDSVAKLVSMMDEALKATELRKGVALPSVPGGGDPAAGDAGRAAWIKSRIEFVAKGSTDPAGRDAAIAELVKGDQKGDCLEALCGVLVELKKDPASQVKILKAIGKPNALVVVPTVLGFLDDRHDELRGNAAVTLEYVGDPRAIDPLTKRLGVEKDEMILADVARALGRCGAKMAAVRKTLFHELETSKSAKAAAGPVIGLAYFEKDAEAARGIEKLVRKESDRMRRGPMLWALMEIGDPKSADFVKKEILPRPDITKDRWGAYGYCLAVANVLTDPNDAASRGTVEGGLDYVLRALEMGLHEPRKDRDTSEWKPKAEVSGGPARFGPPGGGGNGGMGN